MKAISQFITNYNYIIVIINVILIVSVILNINNNKKKIAKHWYSCKRTVDGVSVDRKSVV